MIEIQELLEKAKAICGIVLRSVYLNVLISKLDLIR